MTTSSFQSCSPVLKLRLSDEINQVQLTTPRLNKAFDTRLNVLFNSSIAAPTAKRPRGSDPPRTESMQEEGLAPHGAQQGAPAMGATALTGALPPVFNKRVDREGLAGQAHNKALPASHRLEVISVTQCAARHIERRHIQRRHASFALLKERAFLGKFGV